MNPIFTFVFAVIFSAAAGIAQTVPADNSNRDAAAQPAEGELLFLDAREADVREYVWNHRLVVIMADTPNNPQFARQMDEIRARAEEFVDRDVVVIFDAHPDEMSPLRRVLRPNGFMTAIIDKDGEVKARRPSVRSGRELMGVIDKFPLRRQEILEERPSGR